MLLLWPRLGTLGGWRWVHSPLPVVRASSLLLLLPCWRVSVCFADWYNSFTPDTRCVVFGMQTRAVQVCAVVCMSRPHAVTFLTACACACVCACVLCSMQGMLDFDFMCHRKKPSVAAMIFPFSGECGHPTPTPPRGSDPVQWDVHYPPPTACANVRFCVPMRHLSGNHFQKFYWGDSEIMMPVLSSTKEALGNHPDVEVFVNFASFRSVFETTQEALSYPQIRTVRTASLPLPLSLSLPFGP
jgi:ATP citrate (pro-S)-lyase